MRALKALSSVPRYCVGALMIVVTILVNVEVALRFFVNLPLDALSEIVLLLFPWLSLLGAAVAFDTVGANVALHIVDDYLTERGRVRVDTFVSLATLGFGIFLIVQGVNYTALTRGEVSNTLEISRSWEILAFPVSGALIIAYSVWAIWTRVWSKSAARAAVVSDQL